VGGTGEVTRVEIRRDLVHEGKKKGKKNRDKRLSMGREKNLCRQPCTLKEKNNSRAWRSRVRMPRGRQKKKGRVEKRRGTPEKRLRVVETSERKKQKVDRRLCS